MKLIVDTVDCATIKTISDNIIVTQSIYVYDSFASILYIVKRLDQNGGL